MSVEAVRSIWYLNDSFLYFKDKIKQFKGIYIVKIWLFTNTGLKISSSETLLAKRASEIENHVTPSVLIKKDSVLALTQNSAIDFDFLALKNMMFWNIL